jgi:drug/metabolite transporter, DME family
MQFHHRAILLTIAGAILWSIGGVFIKLLPQDAYTILFYRSFYAAILFLVIFRKEVFYFNKFTLVSALFYAPLLITFVTATKLTTAANAIFLQYTAPAIVLFLEPIFLKTRLLKINIITVILSLLGVSLFFIDQFASPDNFLGVGLALISGFFLAGLLIVQKLNDPKCHAAALFWGNVLVCAVTSPWFISNPLPDLSSNLYLMILGFGQIGFGYLLFMKGQKYLPAIESALIAMLEPILNPIWVMIGYGEIPSLWAVIGALIMIGAIAFRMLYLEGLIPKILKSR